MDQKHRNETNSTLCLIAAAIAIAGAYTHNIHFITIAALLTVACIIDSRGR